MKSNVTASKVIAVATVLMAFILKLFPIFGVGLILNQKKNFVIGMGFFVFVFAMIYSLATYIDLVWIRYATPASIYRSYGVDILWLKVADHVPAWLGTMKWLSYATVAVCFVLALCGICSRKFGNLEDIDSDQRTINAFRVGSGIYIGTFQLGVNNDYRLVFLLFVIPQLVLWTNSHSGYISKISRLSILTIIFSLWRFVIDPLVPLIHLGFLGSLLFEISSWLIFGGLLFLFVCSLPIWVKDTTRALFSWKAGQL